MDLFGFFHSLSKYMPEIALPKRQLTLKEKLHWTLIVAFVYFVLYNVTVVGMRESQVGVDFVQMITASRYGSLITLGIGPIIMAGILLQLFVGAGLLNINLQNPKDRKMFHEVERVLAVFIAIFEGYMYASNILSQGAVAPTFATTPAVIHLIAWQFVLGAIVVMYLDEIVTKYGIGSGISLFIAEGVSFSVVAGAIHVIFGPSGVINAFLEGGATSIALAITRSIPLFATFAAFIAVVYGEGIKVEVPLAFGFMRGVKRNLPLPLFYVSNIPVIFGAALLMNVYFMTQGLGSHIIEMAQSNQTGLLYTVANYAYGVLYLMTPLRAGVDIQSYISLLTQGVTPVFGLPEWVHAITYIITLTLVSIGFGIIWVDMSGMDAKTVAETLFSQSVRIPGFRASKQLLISEMEKYIFPLTVLGSAAVGLLAGLADLTGSLGTGTGILLTVSILHRMEKDIREALSMYYPKIAKIIFGG